MSRPRVRQGFQDVPMSREREKGPGYFSGDVLGRCSVRVSAMGVPSACPAGQCRRNNVSFLNECPESSVCMTQADMIFERMGLQR